MSSGQQEIAQSIRAMLAQHRDVFSVIDPRETRQQILARLPDQGGECREYLARIEQQVNSDQLLAPRNVRLLRDDANVMTFRGHSGGVNHVAALPDGRALSASDDNTLRLWDLASGQCLRVLEGHSDVVNHVATLPDGRALSASWDKTLRLGTSPRANACASWRDIPTGSITSRRCPTGAPSRRRRQHRAALGPRLREMPARPGGTFRSGQSRRGAARRARPLGLMGQHPAALGPHARRLFGRVYGRRSHDQPSRDAEGRHCRRRRPSGPRDGV